MNWSRSSAPGSISQLSTRMVGEPRKRSRSAFRSIVKGVAAGVDDGAVSPVPAEARAVADVLVVERLSKSFGDRVAVSEVSFSLAAGEVFGFLGPNGAGKTTTVRTLATLIEPTSGSALVAGIRLCRRTGSRSGSGSR